MTEADSEAQRWGWRSLVVASIVGIISGWILGTSSRSTHSNQNIRSSPQQHPEVATPNGFKESRIAVHPSLRRSPEDIHTVNEQFAKWGVTPEDIEKNREIEKLQREGHYFLNSERPIAEKATRYSHREMVRNWGAEARRIASTELEKAGVPSDRIDKLVEHLDKTRLASLQLAYATVAFDESKTLLEEKLRTEMQPEALERLKVSILNEGGRLDLDQFRGNLETTTGAPLSPEQTERLLSLLRVTGAYSSFPRDGLYDDAPKVAAGTERVLTLNKQMLAATEAGYQRLRVALDDPAYSTEERTVIQGYFERKIAERKLQIKKLEDYKPENDTHD